MKATWIILLIVFATCGCIAAPPQTDTTTNPSNGNNNMDHPLMQAYAHAHGISQTRAEKFFQQTYGITEEQIIHQLPAKPHDFNEWMEKWESGTTEWLDETPYAVYAQPEFYPTYSSAGINTWANAPAQRSTTIGVSATPAEQTSTVDGGENTIDTTLFISNTWGGTQYEGMKLTYHITPDANAQLTFEPDQFYVGPAFPTIDANWVQKIHVTGTLNAIKGVAYTINVLAISPDYNQAIVWDAQHTPYENISPLIQNSDGIATLSLIPNQPE